MAASALRLVLPAAQLASAAELAAATTRAAAQRMAAGEVRLVLANASHYMTVLGHLSIAWTWLWQAVVATRALPSASDLDRPFYQGKLQACRFFFATELPLIEHAARLVSDADDSAFAMQDQWF